MLGKGISVWLPVDLVARYFMIPQDELKTNEYNRVEVRIPPIEPIAVAMVEFLRRARDPSLDASNYVKRHTPESRLDDAVLVAQAFGMFAMGIPIAKALRAIGKTWVEVHPVYSQYQNCKAAYAVCRELGEEYRKMVRQDEAHRRAVEGVVENVYSASGKLCGTRTFYSDRLLEVLLKGDSPERYSTQRQQVEVQGGVTVVVEAAFDRKALSEVTEDISDADWADVEVANE